MADNQQCVRKRVSIIGQSGVRKWTVRSERKRLPKSLIRDEPLNFVDFSGGMVAVWGKFRIFATFLDYSGMRKCGVITLFNANCLAKSNNSLTHSKVRAIEKARSPRQGQCKPRAELEQAPLCRGAACTRPQGKYGFFCIRATDGAAREEPSLLVLFRVATEVDRRSRGAASFLPTAEGRRAGRDDIRKHQPNLIHSRI